MLLRRYIFLAVPKVRAVVYCCTLALFTSLYITRNAVFREIVAPNISPSKPVMWMG
jgi:hypothetical protein